MKTPTQLDLDLLRIRAINLIALSECLGAVVRIETQPRKPLAMGNYTMVATVQPAREPAVPYVDLISDKGAAKIMAGMLMYAQQLVNDTPGITDDECAGKALRFLLAQV